jgi:hypothetical protein
MAQLTKEGIRATRKAIKTAIQAHAEESTHLIGSNYRPSVRQVIYNHHANEQNELSNVLDWLDEHFNDPDIIEANVESN